MKEAIEAINALKRYDLFILGAHRRILLGKTILELEKGKIKLDTAKKNLHGKLLFNKKILDALEQASIKTKKNTK